MIWYIYLFQLEIVNVVRDDFVIENTNAKVEIPILHWIPNEKITSNRKIGISSLDFCFYTRCYLYIFIPVTCTCT